MTARPPSARESGVALLIVLVVLFIVAVLMVDISLTATTARRSARNASEAFLMDAAIEGRHVSRLGATRQLVARAGDGLHGVLGHGGTRHAQRAHELALSIERAIEAAIACMIGRIRTRGRSDARRTRTGTPTVREIVECPRRAIGRTCGERHRSGL